MTESNLSQDYGSDEEDSEPQFQDCENEIEAISNESLALDYEEEEDIEDVIIEDDETQSTPSLSEDGFGGVSNIPSKKEAASSSSSSTSPVFTERDDGSITLLSNDNEKQEPRYNLRRKTMSQNSNDCKIDDIS